MKGAVTSYLKFRQERQKDPSVEFKLRATTFAQTNLNDERFTQADVAFVQQLAMNSLYKIRNLLFFLAKS
jgi:hypothetical protein